MKDFLGAGHNDFFSIIDAVKVISLEQVFIAYERSKRLIENSEKIKRQESAFLMLMSGEKQISKAQESIGIASSTNSILVVYANSEDLEVFEHLCNDSLHTETKIPIPDKALKSDNEVFSRMARVELSI